MAKKRNSLATSKAPFGSGNEVPGERPTKEDRFYRALENVFIGLPIEGTSGYVNLMKIKSRYYREVMLPKLRAYVEEQLSPFPEFREELYDKLYSFFKRYFSENGSIGLFFTPYHESVYERVYTDDRDVILFWKTARLYYVKTDRLFRNMEINLEGYTFKFDTSLIEHKRNNEKRTLSYSLVDYTDRVIHLRVSYAEGRKGQSAEGVDAETGISAIVEGLKRRGIMLDEDTLVRAIRTFERQAEVDYFICKDAKGFLREQFDLWMWQYLLGEAGNEPDTVFSESRLKKLQALKRVAYQMVDFIAIFENELVKIWNKPRLVLSVGHIITIDRISGKNPEMLHRLLTHPGMKSQVEEWRNLGMVDQAFVPTDILKADSLIDDLHSRYKFLPIDTKYFKDLELEILGLFENLDDEIDGWLIKSENYQALNTILPKWRGKVRSIYIDPPYNTSEDGFLYVDRFRHSTWLTMMYDRLGLAQKLLRDDGVIFVSIGDLNPQEGESYRLHALMSSIFPVRFGNLIWRKRGGIGSFSEKNMTENHEYILVYGNPKAFLYESLVDEKTLKEYRYKDSRGPYRWMSLIGPSQQTKERRPNLNYGIIVRQPDLEVIGFEYRNNGETVRELNEPDHTGSLVTIYPPGNLTWLIGREQFWKHYVNGLIRINKTRSGNLRPEIKNYLYGEDGSVNGRPLKSILSDNGFPVGTNAEATRELRNICPEAPVEEIKPKPSSLIQLLLTVSTSENDWVMDFFAGSGTTVEAALKLSANTGKRRRFIAIEMGDHFDTVIIPRVKRLAFRLEWRDGQPHPESSGHSLFCRYLYLEQLEDILRHAQLREGFIHESNEDPFLGDGKLITTYLEDQDPSGKVRIPPLEAAVTASLLLGDSIRYISPSDCIFEGGERYKLGEIPPAQLKPALWW